MTDQTLSAGRGADDQPMVPGPPTGLVLREPFPWRECVQIAETAEQTGYWAVFVPEIAGREAFATLAGWADRTSRLRLGTGVVTIRSRHPVAAAMGAATVHELSAGRMVLGIGAGSAAPNAGGHGPLGLVGAYVRVVRAVLSGSAVEAGEPYPVHGFRLEVAAPGAVPIWIGALGDRMIRLAGEVADGVLLNWCTPERVARARALVAEGAEAAGRDPSSVTIAVYVRACLGIDEAVAVASLREMTGRYASFPAYQRQFESMGLGAAAAAAGRAFRSGTLGQVPEALVRELTVVGGRTEALARFERYRAAGADVVLCYPVAALDPFSSVLGTLMAGAPSPAVER